MKVPAIAWDFQRSRNRIDEILDAPAGQFAEASSIPSDSELTYTNGFYVGPTALVIDIRRSSQLSHTRPVLAKIYRAYLSEVTAVICAVGSCVSVSIRGDGILAIFDTRNTADVLSVVQAAYRMRSAVDHLNHRLTAKGYSAITVGIGVDDGSALMVKAGFFGSGVNDVIWLGEVVNRATHLSDFASQTVFDHAIMISQRVHGLLPQYDQDLFTWNTQRACYHGDVVNIAMHQWCLAHC